jgi:hypothetical protein
VNLHIIKKELVMVKKRIMSIYLDERISKKGLIEAEKDFRRFNKYIEMLIINDAPKLPNEKEDTDEKNVDVYANSIKRRYKRRLLPNQKVDNYDKIYKRLLILNIKEDVLRRGILEAEKQKLEFPKYLENLIEKQ